MEGRLKELPQTIREVMVPEMFPVSVIASADACLLKTILQSLHQKSLLHGPRVVLGNIAHELVERAIRGLRCEEELIFHELDRVLANLLEDARKRLIRDPEMAPYADLPGTMSPLSWARKRRMILDLAYESAGKTRSYGCVPYAPGHGTFCFENLRRDGRWVEVPIKVPALRLKGRIDVLERHGGEIKIIDIKSGRVGEEDGEIVERILRQVRLYGLMANTLMPSDVVLVVNDGVERPVSFDADIRDETLAWLRSRTAPLPPGCTVSCEVLARFGPDCRWCDIRHRCGRYLRDAPVFWGSETDWRLPLDVWGTVERQDSSGDDLCDMTLIDDGGRRVKIFRLHKSRVNQVRAGDRIWLFELLASVPDLRGTKIHPLNFYEIGDSNTDRAWSLHVFSDKCSN